MVDKITESGSPIGSQQQDDYVEDDMMSSPPIERPSDLALNAKPHLSYQFRISNDADPNDDNSTNNAQVQTNISVPHSDPIEEFELLGQDQLTERTEHVSNTHFKGSEKQEIGDKLFPSKTVFDCNIVVEQVAGISPRGAPNVELQRPNIEGLPKSVVQLGKNHRQQDSNSGHFKFDIPVNNISAQQKPLDFQFMQPKMEVVKKGASGIETFFGKRNPSVGQGRAPCINPMTSCGSDVNRKYYKQDGSSPESELKISTDT